MLRFYHLIVFCCLILFYVDAQAIDYNTCFDHYSEQLCLTSETCAWCTTSKTCIAFNPCTNSSLDGSPCKDWSIGPNQLTCSEYEVDNYILFLIAFVFALCVILVVVFAFVVKTCGNSYIPCLENHPKVRRGIFLTLYAIFVVYLVIDLFIFLFGGVDLATNLLLWPLAMIVFLCCLICVGGFIVFMVYWCRNEKTEVPKPSSLEHFL